eukprot:gene7097-8664_t
MHDAISGGRASEADGGLQPRKRNERRDNVAQLVPPKEGGQKKNKPLQQRRSHFAADNNDSSTDSTASSTNAGSTLTVPSLATHADAPTTVCSPRGFQRSIPSQEEARCATEGKVNSRYNNNGNSAEAKVSTQQPFTSWQQLAWISLKGSLAAQVEGAPISTADYWKAADSCLGCGSNACAADLAAAAGIAIEYSNAASVPAVFGSAGRDGHSTGAGGARDSATPYGTTQGAPAAPMPALLTPHLGCGGRVDNGCGCMPVFCPSSLYSATDKVCTRLVCGANLESSNIYTGTRPSPAPSPSPSPTRVWPEQRSLIGLSKSDAASVLMPDLVDIDVASSGVTSLVHLDLSRHSKLDWLSAANNPITKLAAGVFIGSPFRGEEAVSGGNEDDFGGGVGDGDGQSGNLPLPTTTASTNMVVTSKLRYLDLRNNKITYIATSVFQEVPKLEVLLLQGNMLRDFGIELSSNELTSIAHSAFRHLGALEVLTLDNNALASLSRDTFTGSSNLKLLSLTANILNSASLPAFSKLPALEALLLADNELTTLSENMLSNNLQLREVDFSSNQIERISSGAFPANWRVACLGCTSSVVADSSSSSSNNTGQSGAAGSASSGAVSPQKDAILQMDGNPSTCSFSWRDFSDSGRWDTPLRWLSPDQACIANKCGLELHAASLQPTQQRGSGGGRSGVWALPNASVVEPWGLLPTGSAHPAHATSTSTTAAEFGGGRGSVSMLPAMLSDATLARAAANLAECVALHCTVSEVASPTLRSNYGLSCNCASGTSLFISNDGATCVPVECTPTIPAPSSAQGWVLKSTVCPSRNVGDRCSLECHPAYGSQHAEYRCSPQGVWVPANEIEPFQCDNMLHASPAVIGERHLLPVPKDAISLTPLNVPTDARGEPCLEMSAFGTPYNGSFGDRELRITLQRATQSDRYHVDLQHAVSSRATNDTACMHVLQMLRQSGQQIALRVKASSHGRLYNYTQHVRVVESPEMPAVPKRHEASYGRDLSIAMKLDQKLQRLFAFYGKPKFYAAKNALPKGMAVDPNSGTLFGTPEIPIELSSRPPDRLVGWMHATSAAAGASSSSSAAASSALVGSTAVEVEIFAKVEQPLAGTLVSRSVAKYVLALSQPLSTGITVRLHALGEAVLYESPMAYGGSGIATYSIFNGTLPLGLSLDSQSGRISGMPNSVSGWSFVSVGATDRGGDRVVLSKTWYIVRPPLNVSIGRPDSIPVLWRSMMQQAVVEPAIPPPFTVAIDSAVVADLGSLFPELLLFLPDVDATAIPPTTAAAAAAAAEHEESDLAAEQSVEGADGGPQASQPATKGLNSAPAVTSVADLVSSGIYNFVYTAYGLPRGVSVDLHTGALLGRPLESGSFDVVYDIKEMSGRVSVTVVDKPYSLTVLRCTSADCIEDEEGELKRRAWILALLGFIFFVVALLVIKGCHRYQKFIDKSAPVDFQPVLDGLKAMSLSPVTDTHDVPLELPRSRVELGEVIGEGAFGQVRKAELKVQAGAEGMVRVIVAAKIPKFNPNSSTNTAEGQAGNNHHNNNTTINNNNPIAYADIDKEDAYINLVQEAALMAQFNHPNVIGLIGVCTRQLAQGKPLMILVQYCKFGSLVNFMKVLPKSQEVTLVGKLRMAYDVCLGMDYLSKLHFVHRDLAARNVLVDGSFLCKVSDFGMSKDVKHSLHNKQYGRAGFGNMVDSSDGGNFSGRGSNFLRSPKAAAYSYYAEEDPYARPLFSGLLPRLSKMIVKATKSAEKASSATITTASVSASSTTTSSSTTASLAISDAISTPMLSTVSSSSADSGSLLPHSFLDQHVSRVAARNVPLSKGTPKGTPNSKRRKEVAFVTVDDERAVRTSQRLYSLEPTEGKVGSDGVVAPDGLQELWSAGSATTSLLKAPQLSLTNAESVERPTYDSADLSSDGCSSDSVSSNTARNARPEGGKAKRKSSLDLAEMAADGRIPTAFDSGEKDISSKRKTKKKKGLKSSLKGSSGSKKKMLRKSESSTTGSFPEWQQAEYSDPENDEESAELYSKQRITRKLPSHTVGKRRMRAAALVPRPDDEWIAETSFSAPQALPAALPASFQGMAPLFASPVGGGGVGGFGGRGSQVSRGSRGGGIEGDADILINNSAMFGYSSETPFAGVDGYGSGSHAPTSSFTRFVGGTIKRFDEWEV